MGYSPWGRKESDTAERLNRMELNSWFSGLPYWLMVLSLM